MESLSHYCIVRSDLSNGLRAAYLIHAAGESVKDHLPPGTRAVALLAEDQGHLTSISDALALECIDHKCIIEDGEFFAIGICPHEADPGLRKCTSKLNMV